MSSGILYILINKLKEENELLKNKNKELEENIEFYKTEEHIMCSAIWVQDKSINIIHNPKNIEYGVVYCGYRHCNCFELISHKYDKSELIKHGYIQGFLTNKNRFVDRIKGMTIAKNAGQLLSFENKNNELYSEDLWLSSMARKEE